MANSDSGKDSFEDNIDQINRLISLHLGKWRMKSIPSITQDDIAQELLLHIYKQWDSYDSSRPLGNWITRVISNRLKNIFRDEYYKFASPCLSCPAYLGQNSTGEGECRLFGHCNTTCKIYKKWVDEKKSQHDIKLPVTYEDHLNEINSKPFDEINFDDRIEDLKIKLQSRLSDNDYKIFIGLYIDNKTEIEISKELGYKINTKTEVNRQIKTVKANIINIVKQVLLEDE